MIHLCMYDYSGTSGDCNLAPVKTNSHHDNVRNGVLFLRFIMVSHFFQSCLTTRWTKLFYVQFSYTLWLLGENIRCCLLPVEKYSLLMVKKMFVVDFSKFFVAFNLVKKLTYYLECKLISKFALFLTSWEIKICLICEIKCKKTLQGNCLSSCLGK